MYCFQFFFFFCERCLQNVLKPLIPNVMGGKIPHWGVLVGSNGGLGSNINLTDQNTSIHYPNIILAGVNLIILIVLDKLIGN